MKTFFNKVVNYFEFKDNVIDIYVGLIFILDVITVKNFIYDSIIFIYLFAYNYNKYKSKYAINNSMSNM